jgi:hypothetical protein
MADTLVLYHIPSDRDDPETPNGFTVPKPLDQITVQDLHAYFPLPGQYHFRAKYGNNLWLDLKHGSPLPVVTKRIVLKVLRISWNSKTAAAAIAPSAAPAVAATSPTAPEAPQTVDSFDAFFG